MRYFYLSRSFVDFGPFTQSEVQDFITREIVGPTDYIRRELTTHWMTVADWEQCLTPELPDKPARKTRMKRNVETALAGSARTL